MARGAWDHTEALGMIAAAAAGMKDLSKLKINPFRKRPQATMRGFLAGLKQMKAERDAKAGLVPAHNGPVGGGGGPGPEEGIGRQNGVSDNGDE
jgi:hypothetical protein